MSGSNGHLNKTLHGSRHVPSEYVLDITNSHKQFREESYEATHEKYIHEERVEEIPFIQDFVSSERKALLHLYRSKTFLGKKWNMFLNRFPALGSFMEGVKFVGMTMIIFAFFFAASNFNSYAKQLSFWYNENVRTVEADETVQRLEETLSQDTNILVGQRELPYIGMEVAPTDYRLVIPKLKINIPIVQSQDLRDLFAKEDWNGLETALQSDLKNGVVHYPYTAAPGEAGNFFITGHSSYYPWDSGKYKSVFAVLDRLVIGDQVVVYKEGQKYIYTVYDVFVVNPDQIQVLNQDYTKFDMTLMTCTPTGTAAKRLIVKLQQTYPKPDISKIPQDIQKKLFDGVGLHS